MAFGTLSQAKELIFDDKNNFVDSWAIKHLEIIPQAGKSQCVVFYIAAEAQGQHAVTVWVCLFSVAERDRGTVLVLCLLPLLA